MSSDFVWPRSLCGVESGLAGWVRLLFARTPHNFRRPLQGSKEFHQLPVFAPVCRWWFPEYVATESLLREPAEISPPFIDKWAATVTFQRIRLRQNLIEHWSNLPVEETWGYSSTKRTELCCVENCHAAQITGPGSPRPHNERGHIKSDDTDRQS